MATAVMMRSPAATAENIAVRSAQFVSPYDAFSTLHPENILSEAVRTAAPTAKVL